MQSRFGNSRESKVFHEAAQGDFQRGCNLHQAINGDGFFSALDLADVIVMQISQLGQFFLCQTRALAPLTDRVAQLSAVYWNCFHEMTGKQENHIHSTVVRLFYDCIGGAGLVV